MKLNSKVLTFMGKTAKYNTCEIKGFYSIFDTCLLAVTDSRFKMFIVKKNTVYVNGKFYRLKTILLTYPLLFVIHLCIRFFTLLQLGLLLFQVTPFPAHKIQEMFQLFCKLKRNKCFPSLSLHPPTPTPNKHGALQYISLAIIYNGTFTFINSRVTHTTAIFTQSQIIKA